MEAGLANYNFIYLFFLIMSRYLGLFLITPIFSSRLVQNKIKVLLSFFMAIITFLLMYETTALTIPTTDLEIIFFLIKELSIGVFMGFIIYLVFTAIQMAGQFIDLRMGFRIGNVIDPMSGASSPIMGQFLNIFAILLFLSIDGHHIIIKGLYKSFEVLPLGSISISNNLLNFVIRKGADMFIIGFKIALPVMGTLFVVDIMLGFLARAVPQMNIFIIGLPLKIFVGFVLLFLSFNSLTYFLTEIFNAGFKDMLRIIRFLGSG